MKAAVELEELEAVESFSSSLSGDMSSDVLLFDCSLSSMSSTSIQSERDRGDFWLEDKPRLWKQYSEIYKRFVPWCEGVTLMGESSFLRDWKTTALSTALFNLNSLSPAPTEHRFIIRNTTFKPPVSLNVTEFPDSP